MATTVRSSRLVLMAGLATVASIAAATPVWATSPAKAVPPIKVPTVLAEIKKEGAAAIAERQTHLTELASRVALHPQCDTGGKVAGIIAADRTGLTTLGTRLAGATTVAAARPEFTSIFQDYRVYLVVTPQAFATSACGWITVAIDDLRTVRSKLADIVSAVASDGADMTKAEAALADLQAKIDAAGPLAAKATASLQSIGPDHGDANVATANAATITAARTDLTTARTDLKAAAKDARSVVSALKAATKAPH